MYMLCSLYERWNGNIQSGTCGEGAEGSVVSSALLRVEPADRSTQQVGAILTCWVERSAGHETMPNHSMIRLVDHPTGWIGTRKGTKITMTVRS